jgi:hypothetical protein
MAGNLSCNAEFHIEKNTVSVNLVFQIKNLPKSNKLLSGMTLNKKNSQDIRYALSIKLSNIFFTLLNRRNEIKFSNFSISFRRDTLQFQFNLKRNKSTLIEQGDNLLFTYEYKDSEINFKFIGELYPGLFIHNAINPKQKKILNKKTNDNKKTMFSSPVKEQKKYSNKNSKVKTYYDPSVIFNNTVTKEVKKISNKPKETNKIISADSKKLSTHRENIEQKNKEKKGIYLSKSRWKLCENCLNLQKHNICSVYRIEVQDNNCCRRFNPITVTLGGAFSPR